MMDPSPARGGLALVQAPNRGGRAPSITLITVDVVVRSMLSTLERKKVWAIVIIAILVAVPLAVTLGWPQAKRGGIEEAPSELWVARLNAATMEHTAYLDGKALTIASDDDGAPPLALTATAAAVWRDGDGEGYQYHPVLVVDEETDALARYEQLSGCELSWLDGNDPSATSFELARQCWSEAECVILFDSYTAGVAVAPLAGYYGLPLLYTPENSTPTTVLNALLSDLGARYAIAIGDVAVPADIPVRAVMRLGADAGSKTNLTFAFNDFFCQCLASNEDAPSYAILTNPGDVENDWGEPGYLPLRGVSMAAAQLAAARGALVYFTDGYCEDELGHEAEGEELRAYNQLGARVEVANRYASKGRERVMRGWRRAEEYGGALRHLAIVGDAVGVPFQYEFFDPETDDGVFFSNTNFAASDYYYGNITGDAEQDVAYGRVVARSLTDTTLLCARSLGFEAYASSEFEDGNAVSDRFYETFSGDCRKNAGVFLGTTKVGPLPGALKHMKKYQYQTLWSQGMFVTGEESLRFNDRSAALILDKMNYLMYCGHGDQDCWYSNMVDEIDAQFIATQTLKPGLAAVMACLTGRTDNPDVHVADMIAPAFLHAGLNGYLGASRLAYGLFRGGTDDYEQGLLLDDGALYLIDRVTHHYAQGGTSVGELLRLARNDLIEQFGLDDLTTRITTHEYLCYGDPAWVPAPPVASG